MMKDFQINKPMTTLEGVLLANVKMIMKMKIIKL